MIIQAQNKLQGAPNRLWEARPRGDALSDLQKIAAATRLPQVSAS